MTGAPVPQGADAVVMVEYTSRTGDDVEIQRTIPMATMLFRSAQKRAQDKKLFTAGIRPTPAAIAAAASVGLTQLNVFRSRASQYSPPETKWSTCLAPLYRTRSATPNTYSLAAQITRAGAIPVTLPIAPDEPVKLKQLIEQGLQSDLLLITGGVSMGKYDLVETILQRPRQPNSSSPARKFSPASQSSSGKSAANTSSGSPAIPCQPW